MIIEPRFDPDTRKEIGKAVAIAGLSALATKLVEWGVDEARAWWKRRTSAEAAGKDGAQ